MAEGEDQGREEGGWYDTDVFCDLIDAKAHFVVRRDASGHK
jgi:hypothetical protein